MARRELLTEDERVSLFGVPTERAALARHYTLRPDDLDFLAARRGDANRLGAATWMALLRHPGFGLRHDEAPPGELIAYLSAEGGPLRLTREENAGERTRANCGGVQVACGMVW
jgi:hypothetical protein